MSFTCLITMPPKLCPINTIGRRWALAPPCPNGHVRFRDGQSCWLPTSTHIAFPLVSERADQVDCVLSYTMRRRVGNSPGVIFKCHDAGTRQLVGEQILEPHGCLAGFGLCRPGLQVVAIETVDGHDAAF